MLQDFGKLTVMLYDKNSKSRPVNETRMDMFCHKSRSYDKLPATQDALCQHVKSTLHQAGTWAISDQPWQNIQTPHSFGWQQLKGDWQLVWIMIPQVSSACHELVKCSCKGNRSNRICGEMQLKCTPLCKCKCEKRIENLKPNSYTEY